MQTIKTATSILVLSAFLALPVSAASLNERGSTKDAPVLVDVFSGGSQHHTGLYISGSLGIANIERDTTHTVTREKGETETIPTDATPEEIADYIKELNDDGVQFYGDMVPGGRIFAPQWIDALTGRGSDTLSGAVYGGEVTYLWQAPSSRWGVEVGVAADFYSNGDSSTGSANGTPTIQGGNFSAEPGCGSFCVGSAAGTNQDSFVSVDRKYDIDVPIKLHYFLNDRLSVFGGAGPSFAVASLSGSTAINTPTSIGSGGEYNNSFKETDTSIGYMLTAGFNFWITNRVRLGAEYNFKDHSFDADGGKSTLGTRDDYRNVRQHIESEDQVHAFKAKIGIVID